MDEFDAFGSDSTDKCELAKECSVTISEDGPRVSGAGLDEFADFESTPSGFDQNVRENCVFDASDIPTNELAGFSELSLSEGLEPPKADDFGDFAAFESGTIDMTPAVAKVCKVASPTDIDQGVASSVLPDPSMNVNPSSSIPKGSNPVDEEEFGDFFGAFQPQATLPSTGASHEDLHSQAQSLFETAFSGFGAEDGDSLGSPHVARMHGVSSETNPQARANILRSPERSDSRSSNGSSDTSPGIRSDYSVKTTAPGSVSADFDFDFLAPRGNSMEMTSTIPSPTSCMTNDAVGALDEATKHAPKDSDKLNHAFASAGFNSKGAGKSQPGSMPSSTFSSTLHDDQEALSEDAMALLSLFPDLNFLVKQSLSLPANISVQDLDRPDPEVHTDAFAGI